MNIKNLNFKLNIKSILLFEHLTNSSIYNVDDTKLIQLLYAIIKVNNPEIELTISSLEDILSKNKRMAQELLKDLSRELKNLQSLGLEPVKESPEPEQEPEPEPEPKGEKGEEEKDGSKLGDIIGLLTIEYNLDINYVMYQMELWELEIYIKAIDRSKKEEMTNQRFWTYLQMLPHIDGKKINSPEKLVPFQWEQNNKKSENQKFMEKNGEAIKNFFKRQETTEEEEIGG